MINVIKFIVTVTLEVGQNPSKFIDEQGRSFILLHFHIPLLEILNKITLDLFEILINLIISKKFLMLQQTTYINIYYKNKSETTSCPLPPPTNKYI